ncbi:hypothetical protein ACFY9A_28515 [Streptomyces rubradiris]|uniref:hypothetical protein n=1 Tax=Streptomyces rubradiris TaxID=285531 RepID=UPI0033C50424
MGSRDVGHVRGGSLNPHEPGAVRALPDAVPAGGRRSDERRAVEVDGRPLPEAVAVWTAEGAGPSDS